MGRIHAGIGLKSDCGKVNKKTIIIITYSMDGACFPYPCNNFWCNQLSPVCTGIIQAGKYYETFDFNRGNKSCFNK